MDRPLVLVFDETSTVLANSPEARRLMTELLPAGRKNGVQEQEQPKPQTGPCAALRYWQYPTLTALEAAARRQ